ncbi:hypothetical protein BD560DRAFT_424197 [Blakeslea trispora]|nr:hypothetical protein BD560DRAFT_424197 [Blakeslea trispora]
MLEHIEQKKGLKLKRSLFRQPFDITPPRSPMSPKSPSGRKGQLQISSPILQHSSNLYSIVSPTKNGFSHLSYEELYQPSSPPPPIPQQPNSVSPSPYYQRRRPTRDTLPPHTPTYLPTPQTPTQPSSQLLDYISNNQLDAESRITVSSDPCEYRTSRPTLSEQNRRHSCSSAIVKPQPTKSSDSGSSKSLRNKFKERRSRSKSNAANTASAAAAAAATASATPPSPPLVIKPSTSTPSRKVKTYNIAKDAAKEEERQRRMLELEDLISTRTERTLKLTLTPKGL